MKCGRFKFSFACHDREERDEYKRLCDLKQREEIYIFMEHCSLFECEVKSTFEEMNRPRLAIDVAHEWFREQQKHLLLSWKCLQQDGEVCLDSFMPYLIRIDFTELGFRILSAKAKEQVLVWQLMANYAIVLLFSCRQKVKISLIRPANYVIHLFVRSVEIELKFKICMTELDGNNSEFPSVGVWADGSFKIWNDVAEDDNFSNNNLLQSSNFGKSLSLEFVDKDFDFKQYNKRRRLSDPLSDIQDFGPSASKCRSINKILNLLFMQMVTSEPITDEGALLFNRSDARVQLEKYFLKVLKVLIKVVGSTLNTPSESEVIAYCGNVLLEVTADLDSATVVGYFLQALQTSHQLFKHAAIVLLSSYCVHREINLTVIPHLLHRIIFLYIEVDEKILKYLWDAVNAVIKKLKFSDQMKILHDVSLAVKFSVCCFHERETLPGLRSPEGVSSILSVYEQAIFKGTMRDKKYAAKALQQVIVFSAVEALKPYICKITNVLISNIKRYKSYTCYYQTQGVIVETLAHLISKVGKLLNIYYPELMCILLQTVNNSNKFLYLRSVTALSYLVRFYDKLDELYEHIFYDIKDRPFVQVKGLHLLRYVLKHACVEVPEDPRNRLIVLVSSFISSDKESVRIAAAACLGTMCGPFPQHETDRIVTKTFLDNDLPFCNLLHGRSLALMVALKEAPEKVLQAQFEDKIVEKLQSFIQADNVEVVLNGVKACGYYMLFKLQNQEQIPGFFLDVFCYTSLNHTSEDVNQTFVLTINFIARKVTLPLCVVQVLVYQLIYGLKKGSSRLRESCQYALVAVFNLYKDDQIVQEYMRTLNTKLRESFEMSVLKDLKELSLQPIPEEEDLDFTNIKQQIHFM